jgi:hypothetical protein
MSSILMFLLLTGILVFFFLIAAIIGVCISRQASRRNFLFSIAFFGIQLILFLRRSASAVPDAPAGIADSVSFMWLGLSALAIGGGLFAGSRLRKPGI